MLPQNWIWPVRIFALLNAAGNVAYILSNVGSLTIKIYLVLAIHLTIIWSMLDECRRSARHYAELAAGRRETGDDPSSQIRLD